MKKVFLIAAFVLTASMIAIASKIMLPSEVNVEDFDSVFIKTLGFEVIASLYFVMIYAHNAIVTAAYGRYAGLSGTQIGLRFGGCFALIYLLGMQEVVIESSPFSAWGTDFVVYQFFMGAGEAAAALLMCTAIAMLVLKKKKTAGDKTTLPFWRKASAVVITAVMFTAVRAVAYETGIMHSNADSFPVPVYLWTVVFGIALGFGFTLLYPIFAGRSGNIKTAVRIMILTIGLSWVIFNLFIGLIYAGAMAELLLRSGLDALAIFSAALIWYGLLFRLKKRNK